MAGQMHARRRAEAQVVQARGKGRSEGRKRRLTSGERMEATRSWADATRLCAERRSERRDDAERDWRRRVWLTEYAAAAAEAAAGEV